MAQVYSVNAVGYVNVAVTKGYNLIANPLNNQAGNKVSVLMPTAPNGTTFFKYKGGGYDSGTYSADEEAWTPDGAGNIELNPGTGFWLLWPADAGTITFVGEVPQGTLSVPLNAGYSLVASKVPQTGKLVTDLKWPTPVANNDTVLLWANGKYSSYSYSADELDWVGPGGNLGEPVIPVGAGFWSLKSAAGTWTRDFSVNNP